MQPPEEYESDADFAAMPVVRTKTPEAEADGNQGARPASAIQMQKQRVQQQQQQEKQPEKPSDAPYLDDTNEHAQTAPQPQAGDAPASPLSYSSLGAAAQLPSPTIPPYGDRNPEYTRHTLPLDSLFSVIRNEFFAVEKTTLSLKEYNFTTSMRYITRNRYSNVLAIEDTMFPPPTVADGNAAAGSEGGQRQPKQPVFSSTLDESPPKSSNANGLKGIFGKSSASGMTAPPRPRIPLALQQPQPPPCTTPPPFPYINGNLVTFKNVEPSFVACQAPLPNTFDDFFKTIWENRVALVIMLTGTVESGMFKADRYWPPSKADVKFELRIWDPLVARWAMYEAEMNASVEPSSTTAGSSSSGRPGDVFRQNFMDNDVKDTLVFNEFAVSKDPKSPYIVDDNLKLQVRPLIVQPKAYLTHPEIVNDGTSPPPLNVLQVQYTGWPDHGVPTSTDSFNALIKLIQECSRNSTTSQPKTAPVLVHCSAGIGRTGSLIGAYAALELMKKGQLVNDSMSNILRRMRQCRYGMVQRIEQYLYMYEFVLKNFGFASEQAYEDGVARQAEIYQEQLLAELQNRPRR